jgi:hypothetical protein
VNCFLWEGKRIEAMHFMAGSDLVSDGLPRDKIRACLAPTPTNSPVANSWHDEHHLIGLYFSIGTGSCL